MPGASLHGEKPDKVWDGGKAGSTLDMTLLDEDWFKAQPHQLTPIQAEQIKQLLALPSYDGSKSYYLVEEFRKGFRLRLDRLVHQIVKDREQNKRRVKCNNEMALTNPLAVDKKLEKERTAKRMIGSFTGPVFPAYVISLLGL